MAARRSNSGNGKELPKYNTAEFRIPASDANHQSEACGYRTTRKALAIISDQVSSGKWPYKTAGDWHRHAEMRHIQWLSSLEPGEFAGRARDLEMMHEVVRQIEEISEMAGLAKAVEIGIGRLMELGLRPLAVKSVYQLKQRCKRLSDPYVAQYFLTEIEKRFAHLGKITAEVEAGVEVGVGVEVNPTANPPRARSGNTSSTRAPEVVAMDQFSDHKPDEELLEPAHHSWGWGSVVETRETAGELDENAVSAALAALEEKGDVH